VGFSFQAPIAGGSPVAPTATDVYPNFEQKGVDMRIGIDVATLALKKSWNASS